MPDLKVFEENEAGTDWVVGDIHGCYSLLIKRLNEVGFNWETDRLFSVGDLVDRGPESLACLSLVFEPWFYAVRGNHEIMMKNALDGAGEVATSIWLCNGGQWSLEESQRDLRKAVNAALERMPLAIEVPVGRSRFGIIHANVTSGQWGEFDEDSDVWSRSRIKGEQGLIPVEGIDAVIVGHTPLASPQLVGNVVHIDTGAFQTGALTLFPLQDIAS